MNFQRGLIDGSIRAWDLAFSQIKDMHLSLLRLYIMTMEFTMISMRS